MSRDCLPQMHRERMPSGPLKYRTPLMRVKFLRAEMEAVSGCVSCVLTGVRQSSCDSSSSSKKRKAVHGRDLLRTSTLTVPSEAGIGILEASVASASA